MNKKVFRVLIFVLVVSLVIPLLQSHVATVPSVKAQGSVEARVTASNLRIRQQPGFSGRVLGNLDLDTILRVEGREDQLDNGGIWVYGTPVEGGTTGWVLSNYLAFPTGFVIESLPVINAVGEASGEPASGSSSGNGLTTAAVNFRTGPGLNFQILRTLRPSTAVEPLGRNNDATWAFVNVGGQEGWLYYTLVSIPGGIGSLPVTDGSTTTPEASLPANAPAGALSGATISRVNFRTGPSTGFDIIRTLDVNVPVAFTGRDGTGQWYKVNINGQEGWLYFTLVSINGDPNSLPVVTPQPASSTTVSSGPSAPPAYSAANLGSFSFGAHVAGFDRTDIMSNIGMTWVKFQVRYGGQDAGSVAGLINEAHNRGFRIMLGVVGYPNDVLGGQDYFNRYGDFVAGLAAQGADAIEIWNEQNLDREWANGHIDPGLYTQLLATSYNKIKATNAGTIVISGAPAPTGAEGAFGTAAVWNDDRYLRGMAAAGAASYMDCLGAHYNEGIISPYATSGDPRGGYYTRYYWGMVNTYASIINKPICFTELGYLSPEGYGSLPPGFEWAGDTSVGEHAQWLADAIALSRGSGRVRLVIVWNFNFGGSGADPQGGYAMLRPDGSCPACDRIAGR
jgi:uncharacterized protein YraI